MNTYTAVYKEHSDAVITLQELPCGKIEYIPGQVLSARDAMDEWNNAHPDEEPLRIIGKGAWAC